MSRSTLTQVYDVASAVGVFDDLEHECGQEGLDIPKKDNGIGDNADEPIDSDLFGLDSLIKQRCVKINEVKCFETPEFPPGFTPNPSINQKDSISCNKSVNGASKQHSRFSLLERLTETIKVGMALGLNMEGCENTLASLIADNGELFMVNFLALQETKLSHIDLWMLRHVWGNSQFDFASTSARVRDASERFGSVLNERQTDIFNEFITNSSLIDISLGGFKFTWTDKSGSKMSKLDPFLISKSFYDVFPHVTYVVLKKGIPDHRPILLKDFKVDFGPTSFRGFISFKKKLQNLKRVIRGWVASKRVDSNMLKLEHQSRLTLIDAKINQDCASEEDFNNRRDSMRILDDLQSMENKDLAQKDKIKWAIEGDENTSFLHGTLKKKRRQLAIKGILKDGDWIEDPIKVNAKFYDHFQIKRAVWDCGRDRAPGPDGFSFKFITTFWDLLKEDVVRFIHEFFHTGSIIKGCNSLFIALILKVSNAKFVNDFRPINLIACQYKIIGKLLANRLSSVIESCISPEKIVFIKGRNILDGPIILNEVMAWYRKRKKTLMVFKFDFEKAFDSLRWDYLDMVMVKLGFGLKWCTWIFSCLHNARSFVLVNGSPTFEFDICRGLRKKDPLTPFLFILAMEGLHMLMCKAEESGEWSWLNTHNLLCMLRCFYLISGLKINVNKSNLLGICVPDETVSDMAYFIGCGAASFPMKYLGVRVGCTMARYSNWNTIIQKFSSKLFLWKAHLLSVGGRLSLIKSVLGHILTYYMSIYPMPSSIIKKLESMRNRFFLGGDIEERKLTLVRWNKCLASKDHGGLGIGSISGLNIGLLFKWIWSRIKQKGIDLLSYCIRKVGDGASTKFWEDIWCGDQALKVLFLAYICSTWTCFVLLRTKFLFKTCVLLLGDILEVVRKWFNSQTYKQRLRILCCWIKAILGIGL
ncbi:putative RNA-directed DNA polymerase, eukaryota, reverse transcriptase zinc-binding domain protein [Tanacetum coccineum]